ncbi:MAG: OmpA family protein [Bacteroidales bacterium]|nr:OmpA family protein [Bacteroidales bacterium]
MQKALFFMEAGAYDEAAEVWERLRNKRQNDPEIYYYSGVTFLNIRKSKSEAKTYLELAVEDIRKFTKDSKVPLDAFVYLGISHRITYNEAKGGYEFEESLKAFNELKNIIETNNIKDDKLKDFLAREEKITRNAIHNMDKPANFEVRNMGSSINTEYSEHSAVFNKEETILYFTSKRPKNPDNNKDITNEDIFVTELKNYQWQSPERLGNPVNSDKSHDATVSLSSDGNRLYFFRDGSSDKKNKYGAIYMTERSNDKKNWSEPEIFTNKLSKKTRETHLSVSSDGNLVFFTSNEGKGFGGSDIYVMKKLSNGSWGDPVILPENINTMFDEETPFLHPDGETLYFSSKGHNSMGGFDIFMTKIIGDNKYSDPVNLGYPINTPDDDVSFILNYEGTHGYLSSIRNEGYGDLDLYEFFPQGIYENNSLVYAGTVLVDGDKYPKASITIKDNKNGELQGIYNADENMDYIFPLQPGKEYLLLYKAAGFNDVEIRYTPSDNELIAFKNNNAPLEFEAVVLERIARITPDTRNAVFYKNTAEIANEPELKQDVKKALSENNNVIFYINDNNDKSEITQNRANALTNTLLANGVPAGNIFRGLPESENAGQKIVILNIKESEEEIAPIQESHKEVIVENILFDFDDYSIKSVYKTNLDKITEYMKNNPSAKIKLIGYTDDHGTNAYNLELSEKRAQSVKNYLVNNGVNPKSIEVDNLGAKNPVAQNKTTDGEDNPEGRTYNRRVDIKVLQQGENELLQPVQITPDNN